MQFSASRQVLAVLLHFRFAEQRSDPRLGDLAVQGVVPKLSETPGAIAHLGTTLGAHNEEIMLGELGMSRERYDARSTSD